MYIKSMVLDGFKSYGKRIEITGFDKEFNAITGFNGSGKSNILDAICFVLGITNLSQVRAASLRDLVYKSGQAGVKKATVTITFDNHDRSSSPMGYEHHEEITITRQVVIGGKNKYMINGSNVPNKRVHDMFCSMQLNVNNPHFLIMQGRITKVLNMKPVEILSMIEEAAGTRMYETKKLVALKTIEQKDNKLQEINNILQQEIGPKLEKLKEERIQYIEFQRIERELEHCHRIYLAWKYVTASNNTLNTEKEMQIISDKIDEKTESIAIGEENIKKKKEKLREMNQTKDTESGKKLESLLISLKDAGKAQCKLAAEANSNNENIKAAKTAVDMLKINISDDENVLVAKEKEFDKMKTFFQKLKEQDENDSKALIAAQEKYQKISTGLLQSEVGDNATLEQQLINAKQNITQAQTELKQCEMTLNHNKKQLSKKTEEIRGTENEYKKDNKDLENKENELKNLEKKIKRLNYKDGSIEELQNRKRLLLGEIKVLQEKIDKFESLYSQIRFEYKNPEPNFDRKLVKGLVCTLLTLKDKKAAYALDVAAGGKLYNVIVDTENTSKKLLQYGQLQQRVTIIPLNRVNGKSIDYNTIQFAQKLVGPQNVQTALLLIDFPEETRPAMTWIFGQIFICKDMESAKKIAFQENIRKKCVTLEGDIFDPAGTLSGGAASKTGSILLKLEEFKEIQNLIRQKQHELTEIEATIANITKTAEESATLKQEFDLKNYEINMIRQRLQQTTHHKIKEEIEALKASINDMVVRMEAAKKLECDNTRRALELESQLNDVVNIRERQLKEAENLLTTLRKKAEESNKEWQKRKQESEILELEIKELKSVIQSGKDQLVEAEKKLILLQKETHTFETELQKANHKVNDIQNKVKTENEIINQQKETIQKLNIEIEDIIEQNKEIELDIKKLNHDINSIKKNTLECQKKVTDLVRKYKWIEEEKKYFGKAGGIYDFNVNKPQEISQKIQQLEALSTKLGRNINTRAINLLDKEEEQYSEMLKKKKIIENDKKKILETIQHLDKKKSEILLKAWEQVNKDFGSIFSSLLPGANAKLQPPENQSVTDGLEVKIGFSGVWKESLGELSGGQRSLVALSLILAMLLFKPAPLYILDEVDAALDLSHTENIGIMLKRHFKHSQFIVVSLKDGMFNNANVLFTTRFIDGMSTILRTEKK